MRKATKLKIMLLEQGLSQSDVARQIGVPSSSISVWVSGVIPVPPKHHLELARILGVSPRRLMNLLNGRVG